uniref:Genome polyprotein n=1 Tax=Red-necked stint Picornavirus B-like TaxID=2592520 RepID=A0A5B8KAF1_9PICO|nr:polyprotein [Red-necked stint Picornavirus B-like]
MFSFVTYDDNDYPDGLVFSFDYESRRRKLSAKLSTNYCLPFLKHDHDGNGCKRCSTYWLLKREETCLVEPVYPLKSSCIRSAKINHDTGCHSCHWKRQITPCLLELTHFTYDEQGNEDENTMKRVLSNYCIHCDEFHDATPQNLLTRCSPGQVSARPYFRCTHGPGKRHWWCHFHNGVTTRHICCGCLNESNVRYEGQVSSHPTGNHTNATQAGGNVTTINYYGTNYTAANNPTQQHLDPTAIGSGVGNALEPLGTFIASPTVEQLNGDMSDRILTMIAGNSALITQESAAGAVVAYGAEPAYLEPQHNTVDLPTRPGPSCDRFYTLPSLTWETDSDNWVIPFPGALSNLGVFGTNLQYHYLFRAGFAVHVQCNATQFHAGCLLVAIIPECRVALETEGDNDYIKSNFFTVAANKSLVDNPVNQHPIYCHQYINLRTNNSATLIYAYANVVPASCFTTHNIARIVVSVITPLQSPEGTAQVVPITVTIQPLCSQFNGLRNLVVKQGVPVFEIPGSQQFMTTLANDGFPAFPIWTPMPEFPMAGHVQNLLSVARLPTIMKFGDKNYIEVQNKAVGENELIQAFDLSLLANEFEPTYLARFARLFAYYRGSIILRLMYTGAKQTTGKILVAYTPPGGEQPTTRTEAMLGTHVIWDIGLQSSVEFPIPFVSVSPFRYVNRSGNIFSYDGWITIWYQTAIVTAPSAPTTANIVVTAAAGADFSVRGFMDTAYYQGLGDLLQNAIESTIQNQIAGSVNQLPPALTQPVTLDIQPQIQEGASTALTAVETGATIVSNPSVTQAVEPGSLVNITPEDSSIANLMSRYYFIDNFNATSAPNTAKLTISVDRIMTVGKILKTVFTSATYWRFDLDVVLVCTFEDNSKTRRLRATYCPPGSYAGSASTTQANVYRGVNPTVLFDSSNFCRMRIPYIAPASFLCSYFDGFASYDGTGYGTCPSNYMGEIYVGCDGQRGNFNVGLYIRFVNIKAYMPRPLITTIAATTSHSRTRVEVGDIENFVAVPHDFDAIARYECEDPLPLEYPEGPEYDGEWMDGEFYPLAPFAGLLQWSPWLKSLTVNTPLPEDHIYHDAYTYLVQINFEDDARLKYTMWEIAERERYTTFDANEILRHFYEVTRFNVLRTRGRIDDGYESGVEYQGMLKNAADTVANSFSEAFSTAISKLKASEADIKMDWWTRAIGVATKFISFVVLVMKSRGDPATLAAIGALLSVDIMDACPFTWIRTEICNMFGIAHTQGLMSTIKDLTSITNAAKGLDWILSKIRELVAWLSEKIQPTVVELEKDASTVQLLSDNIREWREYQMNPSGYSEESVLSLANNLIVLRDKLERVEPNSPVLRYISPTMVSVQKFITNTKHRKHEPVGVLIHGPPGSGKSLATNMIGKCLSKHFGGDQPYSLPPDPKYFDNYTCQPVVLMDDLGQNPDGEDMKMLCQMISSTDYVTPQADNPEKGRPFLSKLVLASTNCPRLRPPTIACPKALERRFAFDLDIMQFPSFTVDGMLNMEDAFKQCDHNSLNYHGCCPFICGKAIAFKDRKTDDIYSLDLLTTKIKMLTRTKEAISSKVDVYLQGPVVRGRILRKVDASKPGTVTPKPLTKEMYDLIINSKDKDAMIQYAHDLGYDIPTDLLDNRILTETTAIASAWKMKMMTVAALLTILTTALLVWRMWPADQQGAYSGLPSKRLTVPERRAVEAQGNTDPDTEFAISLMRHNLFPIDTGSGRYTALGIYGKTVVLPRHAAVGPYYVDGREIKPTDEYDLVTRGVVTELTVLVFPELQDFRDIRKFMVNEMTIHSDVILAINSTAYPRMVVPVRKVYPYGTLNIEGTSTSNTLYYTASTRPGYCGGVLVKSGRIVGMHVAGDGTNGYCALLKRSYFCEIQGKITEVRPARKSATVVTKTSLQPSVYHSKIHVTKEPAVLHPKDRRCEVDFEKNLFAKYKGNASDVPPYLDVAVSQYAQQLLAILPHNVTEPLTLDEAVDGYGRLEGLDLSTSAGYPYCLQGVRKRDLVGNGKSLLIRGLDLHGFDLPYVTFLKDELRPVEKVKNGRTRLIECSSVNDTVRCKMAFGKFFEAVISNPGTATGIAVGCNPDIHWTKFAAELGENIIAFDYKNFDASISPFWFEGLKGVFKELGFPAEVDKIIDHICNSTHIYKNIEYDVVGGMPSGCSGTSIFNSMINNLIIKSIALQAYKGIDLDSLKILAYGDDLLFSYPFPLDPQIIADEARKYGLDITPADKGEHFQPPGPITTVTFLKRSFVPDERYKFLYHPVFPYDEILQSLAWTKDPRTMPEHVLSLAYLVWHGGEDEYNKFVALVRSEPVGRAFYLPPWKMLYQAWLDSF